MSRALAIFAAMIVTGSAAQALADSPRLKGSYGFTGTAACLVAPGHFGDANTPPPAPNPTPGVALPDAGFNAALRPNDTGEPTPSQNYSRSFSVEGIR